LGDLPVTWQKFLWYDITGFSGRGRVKMDFYKRADLVMKKVPEGRVVSYGQIALLCGVPGNARQAGYALRTGKAGQKTAYRVVNAQGYLSGAGAFETCDMQRLLLEKEGIRVLWTEKGWKVDMKTFGWKNTLEDAEELRREFERLGV
jgi:methylated-DNA-protein-cysteine methyltransferase-like protein